jgi:hypothetical protein
MDFKPIKYFVYMNLNLLSSVILTNEGIIALISSYNLSLTAYKLVHFTVKWNSSSTSARHRRQSIYTGKLKKVITQKNIYF